MKENFSRRHRLDQDHSNLKYETIPMRFRFDILKLIRHIASESEIPILLEYSIFMRSAIFINQTFEKLFTLDEIHEYYTPALFVDLFERAKWHEVLSLIEHLVNEEGFSPDDFNKLFSYYNLGYEIKQQEIDMFDEPIGPLIVSVKYDKLIEKCDDIIDFGVKYQGVIDSIKLAKKSIINPKKIDLATSIKSSISAVEGFLKGMFKEKKIKVATMGDAIKELEKEKEIPVEIINIARQLYIFRNRTENIGHGSPDLPSIDKDDAYLFLDLSISFINYFFRKNN